jgi:hypothetical protein
MNLATRKKPPYLPLGDARFFWNIQVHLVHRAWNKLLLDHHYMMRSPTWQNQASLYVWKPLKSSLDILEGNTTFLGSRLECCPSDGPRGGIEGASFSVSRLLQTLGKKSPLSTISLPFGVCALDRKAGGGKTEADSTT